MTDRAQAIAGFIAANGWQAATTRPLAGDASNRRYLRLRMPDGARAVLMDAPADRGEDVAPFARIARHLSGLGLSAPRILAADTAQGFLLLEDLGDALFARVLEAEPGKETPLYEAATDVLVELHRHPPPAGLDPYSPRVMADMAALAFDWYLGGGPVADSPARVAFHSAMHSLLERHAPQADVLIQRDYHAENLLWLPDRAGVARVGLLDFQDAMRGHPAYDLVSVLQDARRDVPPAIESAMIDRYVAAAGVDAKAFITAYHCLGAQRNLRILGVFARLCLRDGKAHYVDLIPRVWDLLQRDLAHPALQRIAAMVAESLPAPEARVLQGLKERCTT
ncbi:aminoglycoside phosphotransferase family protein [Roseovarius sp. D22-M7]|uniref:aminoglycoside phosphotransferase family protein n=1 Tax=Roseovarius sp. D22-M7 TaxID=3127116 RepID=UPI00300FE21A